MVFESVTIRWRAERRLEIIKFPGDRSDSRPTDGGVATGAITEAEGNVVVEHLSHHDHPDANLPDTPWLAVAQRGHGVLAAACSTLLPSGIFWAATAHGLLIASDPGAIVTRLPSPPALSDDYLRDYLLNDCPPEATPYEGVQRIPAGHTAVWNDPFRSPQLHPWVGPDHWDTPHLMGPTAVEEYRRAFDRAVATLGSRT
ncbi:MAG: hypothetical protein U0R64_05145 [Candidatus Nanopelagicales bacterium]